MTDRVKRRLTTVLCADVEGYSRLMEVDEPGTLAMLHRHRAAMAALVERRDGRIVNTWGDMVIAEFPSVVEAVQCAVETQQELSGLDRDLPEARRMRFRIGINLSDVMVDGNDIYGDGVNIAARLQERAEPGGIMISGPVYDQVRSKLSVGFDYLGLQQVKNVATPVISYRVNLGGPAAVRLEPGPAGAAAAGTGREPSAAGSGAMHGQGAGSMARAWNRFARLPRSSARLIAIAVMLILINIFTGLHEIWFHWPVGPLLVLAFLRAATDDRPAP